MEEEQVNNVQAAEVEQVTPTPQFDPSQFVDQISERVTENLRPREEAPDFDDLDLDDRDKRLLNDVQATNQRLSRTEAQVQAFMASDTVADSVMKVIPENLRGQSRDAVLAEVKRLAHESPEIFAHANNPEFARKIASLAVGNRLLSGGMSIPSPESGGAPATDAGIPHADEIRKAFKELRKREPTTEELKEYANGWVS